MSDTVQPLFTWRSAICDSQLAPTTRHVAVTLSLYMNERGASAFPGARRLAHDSGLGERTIREHLGILVEQGWLGIVEKGGLKGEERRANHYEARTPASPAPVHLSAPTPASDDTDPCESRTPLLHRNSSRTLRGAPLPDPFTVTPEMEGWLRKECPDIDFDLHTKRFVNHFRGEGKPKKDWVRTWKNWMLREQDRVPQWARNKKRVS